MGVSQQIILTDSRGENAGQVNESNLSVRRLEEKPKDHFETGSVNLCASGTTAECSMIATVAPRQAMGKKWGRVTFGRAKSC
jgi:hypothetical protein